MVFFSQTVFFLMETFSGKFFYCLFLNLDRLVLRRLFYKIRPMDGNTAGFVLRSILFDIQRTSFERTRTFGISNSKVIKTKQYSTEIDVEISRETIGKWRHCAGLSM